ncbi:MAG: RNA polymerase sigma-70 factor [Bacteroidales bacterium]
MDRRNQYHLQLVNGEEITLKSVFDTYYKSICIFIQKFVHDPDEAKDIAQDVFICVWERNVSFSNLHLLKCYLYQTARNKALNALEHETVRKRYLENIVTDPGSEDFFVKNYIERETQRMVLKLLDILPPRAREILFLQLEGYKNQEIAEKLKISVYTVKNHKAAAYKTLKENLKKVVLLLLIILPGLS